MKYLLVLLVLGGAIWLWRHNRAQEMAERKPSARPAAKIPSTNIVACQHCGVHLPQVEACHGIQGDYCGPEHRRLHEG